MTSSVLPQGCTNFRLRRLTRMVSRHYDAHMAASGLKTTQYSLLSHLARLGPSRPVDLAGELKMTASTLSRNLQPLIAAGFIAQSAGADARSLLVQLTETGEAKRREAQQYWKAAQQKINALLGVERVLALHQLIDEAMELLGADDEPAIED